MAKGWLGQVRLAPALVSSGAESATAGPNPLSGFLSLLGAILVLAAVLFLAYKSTKFLGNRYAAQSMRGGYVEVLERVTLAPDRALLIVRLEGKVLLLGMTVHHIQKLDELDPSLYEKTPPQAAGPGGAQGFAAMLRDAVGGFGGKGRGDRPHE